MSAYLTVPHRKRTKAPTIEKVRTLAATGEYDTMTALAREVGVSRERVRQIIRAENIPWSDFHVQLRWDCPGCKSPVSVARSTWEQNWQYMPAYCRSCSTKQRAEFCKRGHLRSGNTNAGGACLLCVRIRENCIVERRSCVGCGIELRITYNGMRQIKIGHATGRRCKPCQGRWAARLRRKTYCLRGHLLAETRNAWGQCGDCVRGRYERKKAATSGGASAK